LPSVPSDVEALTAGVRSILDDLKQVKFQRLGQDLHESLTLLNRNLEQTDKLFSTLNTGTTPQIESVLQDFRVTLDDLRQSIGSDSNFNQDARTALTELSEAARSVKVLSDYLATHPESLLIGKEKTE